MNEKTAQLEQLHNEAMDFADQADAFRRDKDIESAHRFYKQAMEKERAAALGYHSLPDARPAAVAILLRSAATLAHDAGEQREAERLIGLALAGDTPPQIAQELRDLLEKVNFQRHLSLRNIELTEEEVQMSLTGDAVSFGMVQSDVFLDRSEALQDLIYRSAERQSGHPYRRQGTVTPAVRERFDVFLSAFRGGSFTVTYRLGAKPETNSTAISDSDLKADSVHPAAVLEEVITGLRFFEEQNEYALEGKFGKDYFRNFLLQAKRLAPDGKRITQVGLTTQKQNSVVPFALRRVVQRQGRQNSEATLTQAGRVVEIKERQTEGKILVTLETDQGKRFTALTEDAATITKFFQKSAQVTMRKVKGVLVIQEIAELRDRVV